MVFTEMAFHGVCWKPDEMDCLAEVLMSCKALKKLDLRGIKLGDLGAEKLATGLCALANLEELDLGFNKIGDLGSSLLLC